MNLLLTGAFRYSDEQIEYLKSLGYKITFVQDERAKLDFDVSNIDAVVCNGLFLYNSIEDFKNLKLIQLTSAGLDRVPLDYIKKHNIKLYNARGVYSVPMAEFALTGILELYKQSKFFFKNQENKIWQKSRTLGELAGKNALIIGAGSIGSEIAKRLSAFDVNTAGIDLVNESKKHFSRIENFDNVENEIKNADIVVLTLPLSDSTKGFFDKNKFDLMKESSVFVNVSRGALVNESDLIEALKNKKIAGAVIDVFETEPLDNSSPLWEMENVILTPHNSFVGENNTKRMFQVIKDNLGRFINE